MGDSMLALSHTHSLARRPNDCRSARHIAALRGISVSRERELGAALYSSTSRPAGVPGTAPFGGRIPHNCPPCRTGIEDEEVYRLEPQSTRARSSSPDKTWSMASRRRVFRAYSCIAAFPYSCCRWHQDTPEYPAQRRCGRGTCVPSVRDYAMRTQG